MASSPAKTPDPSDPLRLVQILLGIHDEHDGSKWSSSRMSYLEGLGVDNVVLLDITIENKVTNRHDHKRCTTSMALSLLDTFNVTDFALHVGGSWAGKIFTTDFIMETGGAAISSREQPMASKLCNIVGKGPPALIEDLVEQIRKTPGVKYVMVHQDWDDADTTELKQSIMRKAAPINPVWLINHNDVLISAAKRILRNAGNPGLKNFFQSLKLSDRYSKNARCRSANAIKEIVTMALESKNASRVASSVRSKQGLKPVDGSNDAKLKSPTDSNYYIGEESRHDPNCRRNDEPVAKPISQIALISQPELCHANSIRHMHECNDCIGSSKFAPTLPSAECHLSGTIVSPTKHKASSPSKDSPTLSTTSPVKSIAAEQLLRGQDGIPQLLQNQSQIGLPPGIRGKIVQYTRLTTKLKKWLAQKAGQLGNGKYTGEGESIQLNSTSMYTSLAKNVQSRLQYLKQIPGRLQIVIDDLKANRSLREEVSKHYLASPCKPESELWRGNEGHKYFNKVVLLAVLSMLEAMQSEYGNHRG